MTSSSYCSRALFGHTERVSDQVAGDDEEDRPVGTLADVPRPSKPITIANDQRLSEIAGNRPANFVLNASTSFINRLKSVAALTIC